MSYPIFCPIILALAFGQTTPSPPLIPDTFDLKWQLRAGDKFYQELFIQQQSQFKVQGVVVQAGLQYRILSSFLVEKKNDDASLELKQKIEETNLIQADPLTQPLVEPQIKKLPGTVFIIHFNNQMQVTEFAGPPIQAAIGGNAFGLQMAYLLDRDGWKEMAEISFFQPKHPLKNGSQWTRNLTHNWGDLGKWTGKAHYRYEGKQKSLHKIAYALRLAHEASKKSGENLIGKGAFQIQAAGGNIYFDADQGKVIAAEERFHVRGSLEINLLGQKTPVEMEEEQTFRLRVLDKK